MKFDIVKKLTCAKSFRVAALVSKFDLQSTDVVESFAGEIPIDKMKWNVGLIVGNSGTGKSLIAKKLFDKDYIERFDYTSKSVSDDMPKKCSVDEVARVFNSVGFSSVKSWLKPYNVLSNGEKMRVDLARAILEQREQIVFDEFTSVVDRTVAKVGSNAVQKAVRKMNKRFIAVSCHDDIIDWLLPDWIFDTNSMSFRDTRGLLRRPEVNIDVRLVKGYWPVFGKYHYLSHDLNKASAQYVAFYDGRPVAFLAVLPMPHGMLRNAYRVHRLVVLPDYQGIGIGNRLMNFVAQLHIDKGRKFYIRTSHPALCASLSRDQSWRCREFMRRKSSYNTKILGLNDSMSKSRYCSSFEYTTHKTVEK